MAKTSTEDSCPLPSRPLRDLESMIRRMLGATRIAVVGLSDDPSRASHHVAQYLVAQGKQVVPVNPNHAMVLGLKCFPSLESVEGAIEIVNVFRRPEHCADITRGAIAVGAKGVWLQSGIRNAQAEKLAREAGIDFVQDRCIMVDHMSVA
jgi:predicted CoA-binding protein